MNPSKSRVGFFIFLLAAAAPALAAAGDCVAIQVPAGQVFYIPKGKLEALKRNESEDLFLKDDCTPPPAESATLEKDSADKLEVNFLGKKGDKDNYKAYVVDATPLSAKPAEPAADSPEGKLRALDLEMQKPINNISEEIRGMVLASSSVPLDKKLIVAKALQSLKTEAATNPNYEKLIAHSAGEIEEFLGLAAMRALPGKGVADVAGALNGVLAPLGTPAPRLRTEDVPSAAGVALADDEGTPASLKHVLNALETLLNEPEARKHVIERFTRYLQAKSGADLVYFDKAWVGGDEKKLEPVADGVKAWWETLLKTRNGRGEAAVLYYVMGEDKELPPGADKAEGAPLLKALKHSGDAQVLVETYEKPLEKMMLRFTADASAIPAAIRRMILFQVGPYKGQDLQVWVNQYFGHATSSARRIFMETRTKKDVLDSIAKYELPDSSVTVPPGEETRDRLDFRNTNVRAFGFSDLYEEPYSKVVEVPTLKGCCRRLSLRIYTSREKDKYGQWKMVDKLGVFDITEGRSVPPKIYGRRFALDGSDGKLKEGVLNGFRLDDRRPNSLKYDLSVQNGQITLVGTGRGGGGSIGVNEIFALRNKQLKEQGYTKKIGKETFWVVGQGGRQGTLLYFRSSHDQRPTLMAPVSELSGGRSERIPGDRWLGVLKSSAGADVHWYLRWNEENKHYDYVTGPAYDPDKDPANKPGPTTTTPTTTTPPTTSTPREDDKPTTTTPEQNKPAPTQDAVAAMKTCNYNQEDMKAFAEILPVLNRSGEARADGWAVWVPSKGSGNASYLCVNGKQVLSVNGVIPADGIKTEGGYLVVTALQPAQFVRPEFQEGKLEASKYKRGSQIIDLESNNYVYYLPLEGFEAKFTARSRPGMAINMASIEKLSWVKERLDVTQSLRRYTTITVVFHDGEDNAGAIDRAVGRFGGETPVVKTHAAEFNRYVTDMLKPAVKAKADARELDKDYNSYAYAQFSFFAQQDLTEAEGRGDAIEVITGSLDVLPARAGTDYQLVYCGANKILEFLSKHDPTTHKKKSGG